MCRSFRVPRHSGPDRAGGAARKVTGGGHRSEADDGELRVTDLASATTLSLSRIPRVVNSLQARGWVGKRRHVHDTRGWVTSLTDEGLRRLESAYPALLLSARRRVVDHVDCGTAAMTAHQTRRNAFAPA
ncbi:helix-turn-helix domain-containing protein [Actinacidiphila glaucinigra]|uniref:hypothetical protein n=1 Tax=Actinacidiphila glaucinigra TaxID=235986 RepID=UPI000B7951C6|nr:hypothetical protein [Actinacidiphila glaucinigra]